MAREKEKERYKKRENMRQIERKGGGRIRVRERESHLRKHRGRQRRIERLWCVLSLIQAFSSQVLQVGRQVNPSRSHSSLSHPGEQQKALTDR